MRSLTGDEDHRRREHHLGERLALAEQPHRRPVGVTLAGKGVMQSPEYADVADDGNNNNNINNNVGIYNKVSLLAGAIQRLCKVKLHNLERTTWYEYGTMSNVQFSLLGI